MTICKLCRYGTVIEDARGNISSYCHEMMYRGTINYEVKNCSTFEDKKFIPQYELEKIAWEINVSKNGIVGFNPPKKDKE